jgi:hypothetical protein
MMADIRSRRFRLTAVPVPQLLQLLILFGLVTALVAVSPADPAKPTQPSAAGAAAAAPLTIELDNVPPKLSLPAGAGENEFITAVVRGQAPARVWLARSEDASFSVTIPPMGDGHYQLNLADDRVVLALRRTGGGGQCYVFASAPGGEVIQSAAIRVELAAPTASFWVNDGVTSQVAQSRNNWFQADKTAAVSVNVDPSLPGMTVHAEAGGKAWAFAPGSENEFVLAATPEISAVWEQNVELHIRCEPSLHSPSELTLRAIPTRLELPPDGLTLTATGNSNVVIPGTRGYLSFQLGSIYSEDRNGRPDGADVTLRRADDPNRAGNDPPVGEARVFHVGDQQFVWFVASTERRADGSFATLRVVQGKPAERQVLRTAFARVGEGGSSCCNHCMTFNGKDYDASGARSQLEELLRKSGADDVAGFLEAVGSREKEVGSEVRIVTGNGSEKPLRQWLTDSIRKMGWDLM